MPLPTDVDRTKQFRSGSIGEKNQQKVLAAATTVFSRKGFAGARIEEIARHAGMSKPNLLYYYNNKTDLYRAVLVDVLSLWLDSIGEFHVDADPLELMTHYIAKKMELSKLYPEASRVIATEIISGSPVIEDFLRVQLYDWVASKGRVLLQWQAEGLMAPIEPAHVFFMIWASTQTYADFESQISAVLRVDDYQTEVYDSATSLVTEVLTRGLGLKSRNAVGH